jgi:hypothetical protein
MIKRILIVLLFPPMVWAAAPTISNVNCGDCGDGDTVTLTVANEGSRGATVVEWIGGAADGNGNIEDGTPGESFARADWIVAPDALYTYDPQYSTANAHSGSQSIISQWPVNYDNASFFEYDTGITGFGYAYFTYWIYFDHVDTEAQWKMIRISPTSSTRDADGDLGASQYYYANGSGKNQYTLIFCNGTPFSSADAPCYPNESYTDIQADDWLPTDQWVRAEVFVKESSDEGVKDGTFEIYLHYQSQTPVLFNRTNESQDWSDNVITRNVGISSRLRYIMWQNYWGNVKAGTGLDEKIYVDDIFIQVGSQARVEIGNSSVFISCTHREIVGEISSWGSGSIVGKMNFGSFSTDDTVYFFVINSDGEVNSTGYAVVLGGGSTDVTAPTLTNHDPLPDSIDIAVDDNIDFDISDANSNVDSSTIQVTVNGDAYVVNGAENAAFCSATVDGDAAIVSVSINPDNDFSYGSTITVNVTADDTAGSPNSMDETYYFYVVDFPDSSGTTRTIKINGTKNISPCPAGESCKKIKLN